MNGFKQLLPVGSITGDPIGARRYAAFDPHEQSTAVSETIALMPDGTECTNPYYRRMP
jgi:hypothetical protein